MSLKTPDSVALYHTFVSPSGRSGSAVMNADGSKAKLRLFGPIYSFERTAELFAIGLDQLRASGVVEADLEINSPGGSVSEALAIHDMIASSGIKFRAVILGIAASAATVVACACEERVIGKNARFMIHEPESGCYGRASDMREAAEWLDQITEQTAAIYAAVSGKSVEQIKLWMKEETWWKGEEAVKDGFAKSVLEKEEAAMVSEADMRAFQKAPADLLETVQEVAAPAPESAPAIETVQEAALAAEAEMAAPEAPVALVETPGATQETEAKMLADADPVIAAMKSDADSASVMTARPTEAAQPKTASAPSPWAARIAEMNRNFGRI